MSKKITDKQRLDWLEAQNAKAKFGGICVFRWSTTGRGWRLHETNPYEAQQFQLQPSNTVREAIDKEINKKSINYAKF